MRPRTAVAAWAGLSAGGVVLGVVVALLNRVVRPAVEIQRYADDILEAGVAIATNLDGADQLARTRELALAAPDLALRYLDRLGGR